MNFAGCFTALETATSGLACVVLKKWRGRENDLGRALPSAPAKVQGLLFFEACLLSRAVLVLSWLVLGAVLRPSWACLGLSRHF